MNEPNNTQNISDPETTMATETPAVRRPSRPAAIIGCIAAAISLIAFAFLAYFQILALSSALEPPPTEGIDARRLGLALGWFFSLICGVPQVVFGGASVICLRRAEKRTPLWGVRLAAVLALLLAVLSTVALTGYIIATN